MQNAEIESRECLEKIFDIAYNRFENFRNTNGIAVEKLLKSTIVIAIQHILDSTPVLFKFLHQLGLPKDQLFLTGKCYSSIPQAFDEIKTLFNEEHIISGTLPTNEQYYTDAIQKDCYSIIDRATHYLETHQNIEYVIVVDEGGKLSASDNFPDLIKRKKFLIVEHTTQGNYFPQQKHFNSVFINFARCAVKYYIEPRIIRHEIQKTIRLNEIFELAKYKAGFKIGVIGLGAIGQEIVALLVSDKKEHPDRFKNAIRVYDIDTTISKRLSQKYSPEDIEISDTKNIFLTECNYIIGCTGKDVTANTEKQLEISLKDYFSSIDEGTEKYFISFSSGDIEFKTLIKKIRELPNMQQQNPLGDIGFKKIKVLNAGYPSNFFYQKDNIKKEATPPALIAPTRLGILFCILDAIVSYQDYEKNSKNEQYSLNPQLQQIIFNSWREVVGDNYLSEFYELELYNQLKKKFDNETALLATEKEIPIEKQRPQRGWNLPTKLPYFVERSSLHEQITTHFKDKKSASIALSGLGGIGKTQLANHYIHSVQNYMFKAWFEAESVATLQQDYWSLAERLQLIKEKEAPEQVKARLCQWFKDNPGWLLVYDNAPDYDSIYEYLPEEGGDILITSRSENSWLGVKQLAVSVMSLAEARLLMKNLCGEEGEHADKLLQDKLGLLPLAITQAASYMKRHGTTAKDYMELYAQSRFALLSEGKMPPQEKHEAIAITWRLNKQELQKSNPKTIELLEYMAFLNANTIPTALLRKLLEQKDIKENQRLFENIKAELLRYSLIALTEDKQHYNIHPLLQEFIGSEVLEDSFVARLGFVASILEQSSREQGASMADIYRRQKLLPHLLAVSSAIDNRLARRSEESTSLEPLKASLLANAGIIDYWIGNAHAAKEQLEKALAIKERHYGKEHVEVARTLGNLANAYGALGDVRQKKALLEKTLAIFEAHYGKEHVEVARTLRNLATAYGDLGNVHQAKALLEKALAIEEVHYGKEHVEVARTLDNLAVAYGALGDVRQQKALLEKALAVKEAYYGKEHVEVARTLGNLAVAYGDLGDARQKQALLEKALAIKEAHYGKEHVEVARTLDNLAVAYGALGDVRQQKALLEKALPILEAHYGPSHPETAVTLHNLGVAYRQENSFNKAKMLIEQALAFIVNYPEYGEQHPYAQQWKKALDAIHQQLKLSSPSTPQSSPLTLEGMVKKYNLPNTEQISLEKALQNPNREDSSQLMYYDDYGQSSTCAEQIQQNSHDEVSPNANENTKTGRKLLSIEEAELINELDSSHQLLSLSEEATAKLLFTSSALSKYKPPFWLVSLKSVYEAILVIWPANIRVFKSHRIYKTYLPSSSSYELVPTKKSIDYRGSLRFKELETRANGSTLITYDLVLDAYPAVHSVTGAPIFRYFAYEGKQERGHIDFYQHPLLCASADRARHNVFSATGIFVEVVKQINLEHLSEACEAVPPTVWDEMRLIASRSGIEGAKYGVMRGVSRIVTNQSIENGYSPDGAQILGKVFFYICFYFYQVLQQVTRDEQAINGTVLWRAAIITGQMIVMDLIISGLVGFCHRSSEQLAERGWTRGSHYMARAGQAAGAGLYGYQLYQQGPLAMAASTGAGVVAEQGVVYMASAVKRVVQSTARYM